MMARKARRFGFGLAVIGAIELVARPFFLRRSDLLISFPGGTSVPLTFAQAAGIVAIPVGLLIGATAFVMHRRFTRAAMADPVTAAIFDPSVEWPTDA